MCTILQGAELAIRLWSLQRKCQTARSPPSTARCQSLSYTAWSATTYRPGIRWAALVDHMPGCRKYTYQARSRCVHPQVGQAYTNLQFILENEPELPGCEKRWVVSHIFNETEDARIMALLSQHGQVSPGRVGRGRRVCVWAELDVVPRVRAPSHMFGDYVGVWKYWIQ